MPFCPSSPSSLALDIPRSRSRARWLPLALALLAASCSDDLITEPSVESVVVTSPIGEVMAIGRSVQLGVQVLDGSGDPIDAAAATFSSSDPSVAAVNHGGVVVGMAVGTSTLTAEIDGVAGSMEMRVVAADLDRISLLLDDPYTALLMSALDRDARAAVEAAWSRCSADLEEGDVLALEIGLRTIGETTSGGATDRALLAVLAVISERAILYLNL